MQYEIETIFIVKGYMKIEATDDVDAEDTMFQMSDTELISDSEIDFDSLEVDEVNLI